MSKIKGNLFFSVLTVSVIAPIFSYEASASTKYTLETKNYYAVSTSNNKTVKNKTMKIDIVKNPNGGAVLGLLHNIEGANGSNKYLLEIQDGGYTYAFKDMNKNGTIDVYEDWRLPVDQRAQALANNLIAQGDVGIKKIAGLMLFSSHEFDSAPGLTEEQKKYLDSSNVRNITDAAGNNVTDAVGWANAMQAHVEKSNFNVPVDFSSDPRSTAGTGDMYSDMIKGGNDLSKWPSNIGMAATFDTEHMYNFAKATSAEYRALGIVTALGPQIDLATEPRWLRVGGTFGENTLLSTDMAQAYVDGSQSTYAADGTDLGWGKDSINCMIKHFPGDGAAESGRESHTRAGKYAVYPGNNFDEHLTPFSEGGLTLKGKTARAAAVMSSYSIGIDANGNPIGNQRVGSAYNHYKMDILRKDLGFDGAVCTDWGVTKTPPDGDTVVTFANIGMAWGKESETTVQRHYDILMAGGDMFGGNNDAAPIVDAYHMMVKNSNKATADIRFATSAKRLIKLTMAPGLFENPYLDLAESQKIVGNQDKIDAGYQAQLDSVVMLKNKNNVIHKASEKDKKPKDMTVYIPQTWTEEVKSAKGNTPASWQATLNLDIAKSIYGKVVTDTIVNGKAVAPDLSHVDKVIVGMRSPNNGDNFSEAGLEFVNGEEIFTPLSLQYGEYVANGDNVRKISIAGNIVEGVQQNRSYYGKSAKITNAYDLTATLNAVKAARAINKNIPVIVALNANGPIIVSEFEDKVDGIIVGFSVSDKAVFDIIEGKHEPRGLLPLQFPANMDTVEAQLEDVGQDMTCYQDSEGNTYDVAYGLNWSGIINDARVVKYNSKRPDTKRSGKTANR